MLTGADECLTPASYTPVLHDVEVPQLHDLLLPLVDICELLDLLQEEQSSVRCDVTGAARYWLFSCKPTLAVFSLSQSGSLSSSLSTSIS